MKTVQELLQAYPYMFGGKNIGLTLYRGWHPTFAKLCEDIDQHLGQDKRDFHWEQLKEKFGAARWYGWWALREGERRDIQLSVQTTQGLKRISPEIENEPIQALINAAQDATAFQCVVCGEPARIAMHKRFGYQCLCKKHANVIFGGGQLPKYWFEVGHDDPEGPWEDHAHERT